MKKLLLKPKNRRYAVKPFSFHKLSALTIASFFIYLLCLTIPVSLFSMALIYHTMNEEIQEETARIRCEQVTSLVSDKINSMCESVVGLFDMNWFQHLNSRYDIYDKEFNVPARCEIRRQVEALKTETQLAEDILVVLPRKDIIISTGGWFSLQDAPHMCHVRIDTANAKETEITALDSVRHMILRFQDTQNINSTAAIGIVLSAEKVCQYVEGITNELPLFLKISCNGQTLYLHGEEDGLKTYTASKGISVPVQVTVGYTIYRHSSLNQFLQSYLWIATLTAIVLVGMAILLTAMKHRPLNKLIRRSLKEDELHYNDVYQKIGDAMDTVRKENHTLQEMNLHINQSMQKMRHLLQTSFIYSMLSPNFDFEDPLVDENLPWVREGLPFLILIFEKDPKSNLNEPALQKIHNDLTLGTQHIAHWYLLQQEQLYMLWYAQADEARRQAMLLQERIYAIAEEGILIATSPLMTNICDIRESYYLIRKELDEQRKERNALPLTLQIGFVTNLQSSHEEECLNILQESAEKYPAQQFGELLMQVAQEYSMEKPIFPETVSWEVVRSMTSAFCKRFEHLRHSESLASAEAICHYIDEHYPNPDISIKQLSDYFSISGTLISKIFKARYGMTFSDYLLDLRMRKALELLQKTQETLITVAEKTGYLNYYSFKRAFIRKYGLSPREYRENAEQKKTDSLSQ